MKKQLIGLVSLILCINLPVIADTQTISEGKMGALTVKRWSTSQGMQVLFAPSHELPMVDLRLVFDAGAARDKYELAGVAKLTNTLMFEGSKNITSDDVAKTFEQLGSTYSNGSYRDMAVLTFRSLSEKNNIETTVETVTKILDQPLFDQESFTREKNKLKVALKLSQENPSSIASLAFFKALYESSEGDRHPYATQTKGTEDSLNTISTKDLNKFYEQYYVANNAVLAIIGDISLSQAKQYAEQIAGKLNTGQHAAKLPAVAKSKKQLINIEHDSTQSAILIGQASIKRGDPDYYPLYVGNHILGGSGFSSRLVKDIRVKHGLTYSVGSYFSQMRERGPFQISLTTKSKSAQQAIALVEKNVREFIAKGPSKEELDDAKLNISGSFPLRTSSNRQIGEHLSVIGFYNLPINYLNIFKEKVEAVTIEDIKNAFKRRLDVDNLATIVVGPKTK